MELDGALRARLTRDLRPQMTFADRKMVEAQSTARTGVRKNQICRLQAPVSGCAPCRVEYFPGSSGSSLFQNCQHLIREYSEQIKRISPRSSEATKMRCT